IGNGKFLKSYQMKTDGTLVVVKVYIKLADEDLALVTSRLTYVSRVLSPRKYPFLLPYQMWLKSNARVTRNMLTPTYLVRQYFKSNLYDRLATRPFLNRTEKQWLIYQLLRAVEVVHREHLYHGDIKPENIMVTSWNWLILTDFATYKPVSIPEDDPTDFQYFYESSGRRRCYVAPERFVKRTRDHRDAEGAAQGDLRLIENDGSSRRWGSGTGDDRSSLDGMSSMKAMDVFSLGCTIAEILMDGIPLIDLPGILKYRAPFMDRLDHDLSPSVVAIQRIKDPALREVVCRMTARNPDHRPTISEVLMMIDGDPILPSYFKNYVYDLFLSMHWQGMLPDTRIAMLCQNYEHMISNITGSPDVEGTEFFSLCYQYSGVAGISQTPGCDSSDRNATDAMFRMAEAPSKYKASVISSEVHSNGNRVTSSSPRADVSKEIYSLGVDDLLTRCEALLGLIKEEQPDSDKVSPNSGSNKTTSNRKEGNDSVETLLKRTSLMHPPRANELSAGLIIIIEFICTNLRHLRYPHSRIASLVMLLRMAAASNSEVILQRIVPFMLLCFEDPVASVRALSIRLLCAALSYVDEFLPHERFIFLRSIFPALNDISRDGEVIVRVAFVECLGKFAELSKYFLDKSHAVQMNQLGEDTTASSAQENAADTAAADNDDTEKKLRAIKASYDANLAELHANVSRWVTSVLLEQHSLADSNLRSGSHAFSISSHSSRCKKILLTDIVRLCGFFGTELTLDVLLSQLLTFLNDQDWELRLAFCAALPGVCAFLGETFTCNFIYPCIENALVDVEVMVVSKALDIVAILIQLNLLSDSLIEKTLQLFSCLVVHPTHAIRCSAIDMVRSACDKFGATASFTMIRPCLFPFLEYDIFSSGQTLTRDIIQKALQRPVSARGYRMAMLKKRNELSAGSAVSAVSVVPTKPIVRLDLKVSTSTASIESSTVFVDGSESTLSNLPNPPDTADSATPPRIPGVKSTDGLAALDESQVLDESCETIPGEGDRVKGMSGYIEQAAYEMNTKTLQWRNASAQAGYGQNDQTRSPYQYLLETKSAVNEKNNSRVLDIPEGLIPASAKHSLRIPHQKSSVGIGISEDMRALSKNPAKLAEDPLLIHKVFGIRNPGVAEVMDLELESTTQALANADLGPGTKTTDINCSNHIANALAELSGTDVILRQIKGLKVPPLPRNMGSLRQPDGREYSMHVEPLDMSGAIDPQSRAMWRPKDAVQLASLTEHSQAVSRLAVAQDQSFFVSASADRTARVWQIAGLENNAYPRSALTYAMHTGRLTDVTTIENSHSVATSCEDGSVHVWRVDVAKRTVPANVGIGLSPSGGAIKNLPSSDGAVVCLQHFNGDSASFLTYCTARGSVKSWDLRCSSEPFEYRIPPELGYPTAMTLAPDKNWMCVGTSKGCVALWDIRYNVMNKLWQHSSASNIHRLASCKTIAGGGKSASRDYPEGAYLFLAAGKAEAAVWGLPDGGECLRCYRTATAPPVDSANVPTFHAIDSLPVLNEIPLLSHHARYGSLGSVLKRGVPATEPSVRTVIGRISGTGSSYIITAGSDRYIRFWDFSNHANSFTVSGLDSA
ncbi:unnamed protein product, partial [Ectocarpus fasciculatus]